jgi:hypothetical protein
MNVGDTVAENEKKTKDNTEKRENGSWYGDGF